MITVITETTNVLQNNERINVGEKIHFKWNGDYYTANCVAYHLLNSSGQEDIVLNACLFDAVCEIMQLDSRRECPNFEESYLYEWLHTEFLEGFDSDMLRRIADVTIPSLKDIFMRVDDPIVYNLFYPDSTIKYKPFDIMISDPTNKIAIDKKYRVRPYWLSSHYNDESIYNEPTTFYGVGDFEMGSAVPTVIKGVRPLLILR